MVSQLSLVFFLTTRNQRYRQAGSLSRSCWAHTTKSALGGTRMAKTGGNPKEPYVSGATPSLPTDGYETPIGDDSKLQGSSGASSDF